MHKRERLERTFAGEATDRVPVALWRHWPGDDQRAADLAQATVAFQQRWDWDFVKISPADSYPLNDYGTADVWRGTVEGIREYVQRAVVAPEDWANLPELDPTRGWLGMHLETMRQVRAGLGPDVPVIFTVFSPLAQAKNLAGEDRMFMHLRLRPDLFKQGIARLTENTQRYLDAMRDTGIDGIYYAVQHATYEDMHPAQYAEFGREYDLRLLENLPADWWFNLLHVHGTNPMLDAFADYPVQAINWHDRESGPTLAEGKTVLPQAVSGGLGAWDEVHNGTPDSVHAQARDALAMTGSERFILATGCVLMVTTPESNIRAVREAVEG